MPQEAKDEKLSEAQKKGHEEKRGFPALETTLTTQDTAQPEISQRIQTETLDETVECASCKMGFHISKATLVDNKYYCPQHTPKAKSTAKIEPTPFKPKETGDYRKALMSPQHSKGEERFVNALRTAGLNVSTDIDECTFCTESTVADCVVLKADGKRVPVYYDDMRVHAKREDKDEALRDKVKRRYGVVPVSAKIEGDSEAEFQQRVKEAVEALKP
jgi:hypothetical protein